jgi:hypothetical protein
VGGFPRLPYADGISLVDAAVPVWLVDRANIPPYHTRAAPVAPLGLGGLRRKENREDLS